MQTIQSLAETITPVEINDALLSPRTGIETKNSNGKYNAKELIKMRGIIGRVFGDARLLPEWKTAMRSNGLMNSDILAEKFETYKPEFARLHKAVQDTFKNAGMFQKADNFGITVPVYTPDSHPIDFIATLLKGANNPITKAVTDNEYEIIKPFKPAMQSALINKGVAAPNEIDTLAQLFYNTVVAKEPSEQLNFDSLGPGETYHADDAVSNAILAYFKTLADKKQSGETLSKTEDKLANAAINVQEGLKDAAIEEVNKQVGASVLNVNNWVIIGIAVVVLIMLIKK